MSSEDHTSVAATLATEPGPNHLWKVSLYGKVIAITGANQGIGLGIAEVCLANSAKAVYSLDIDDPGQAFGELQQRYRNLQYIAVDIREKETIEYAIEKIYSREGSLDGFVANAGMTKHQPALDFSEEQLRQIFDLNAAPSAPYGGTKAAIRNMAHTLAMEWAPHGIRVNSVSPGFVRTQMTTYMESSPDWDLKMKYYGGMPRLARPQELGGAYVYLMSDAATYTTGIDIPVAGIVGAW
ncbi:MAG: hypothetical protein L6R38_000107 [Xanthoria sp. 2 TBL-2021]|nr:MAG: hypothetical protein L6R38_000107 [Xanthoria sp. 2 TBL-2021]